MLSLVVLFPGAYELEPYHIVIRGFVQHSQSKLKDKRVPLELSGAMHLFHHKHFLAEAGGGVQDTQVLSFEC